MNKIEEFAQYHNSDELLIIYNIWDAGSAKAVENAGAKVIATGSLSVAGAQGFDDGEKLPLDMVFTNAKNIISAVNVPVSIDFETGYGMDASAVGRNVSLLKEIGIAGINIEDQILPKSGLRNITKQAERIKAAADSGIFVNARTDIFIQTRKADHDKALALAALERCKAYTDAGAMGFFIPFVTDEAVIAEICENSDVPVNCMMMPDSPSASRMKELGVSRLSYGPGPWNNAMKTLEAIAADILAH